MLAFLDRGNIGNAETAGMQKTLHLKGNMYNWLLTIFFITYIIFEFFLLLWKIFPPHIVGAIVVFAWGLLATCQAAVTSWSGMMAVRFFLGLTEAGYGTGVIYLLTFFYLRHEVGLRMGIFVAAAPLASTFSGALAYGITSGHPSIASWRLLFLVEGLPTICMAPIAWYFIPDSPDKARFLNAEEKEIVKSRALRQTGEAASARVGNVSLKDMGATLLDVKAWLNSLMYFSTNVSYASLPLFLPTILKDMGYSAINAQGLSAPPYFVAFLFAMILTYIADRTQQRALMIVFTSCLGGIGYVLLATVKTVGVRYFAVYLAAAGVFPTIPNILAWTMSKFCHFPPSFHLLTIVIRQPRQRHPPRHGARPDQPHRSVRTHSRHQHLCDYRRATLYQGYERLRGVYVLRHPHRHHSALDSHVGEQAAGQEIRSATGRREGGQEYE